MAWTQADLDRVDAAIANGNVKSVTYADGRAVQYESRAELLAVRREIRAELLASASQARPFRRATVARYRRP
jgi:phage baseplate assembly protein gpV